jgi:RES domain-containing protein
MASPEPSLDQLKARLTRLLLSARPLVMTTYRSTAPKYATETDLRTGEGSRQYGGRWNPIGIAVVYASLTPETAMAEALAQNRYYGLPIEDAMPRTLGPST